MFKASPQRNTRCKDFKVKNALQICVLIGVCIWLAYLAQHSRQEKASYGEDTKSGSDSSEVVKLGRKDPNIYVEQSSIIDTKHKEEENEEENKYEEQTKTDNINGVEDEIQMQKNEQNNNEEKLEHGNDPMNQDIKESIVANKEIEENEHRDNMESEDNKNKEGNKSREISDEKNESEKEETRETEKDDKENEKIDQNITEAEEEHKERNHKQDSKDGSNAIENEKGKNDEIHEVDLSEDPIQDQDRKKNNEDVREESYAFNVVGMNKTEQFGRRENNEFELESQANGTEVTYLHQNEMVLNETKKTTQVTSYNVTTTNQGKGSENQVEKKNDSHKSFNVESNEQERHNKPSSDDAETLQTYERNTTNEEDNGQENANGNDHDGLVSASNSSILEEEDASSKKNDDVEQVENENINIRESEGEDKNELVESQKEKEESIH
uniref:Midasin n=1 Tax=Cajanus cajan TaxID=3821 RepID=A0A151TJ52_CAJCA|nr:Midasin [Cajanus cajan]